MPILCDKYMVVLIGMTDIRRAFSGGRSGGRSSIGGRTGGRNRSSDVGVLSPPSPHSSPPTINDQNIDGNTTPTNTILEVSTAASAVADPDDRITLKIENNRYVIYIYKLKLNIFKIFTFRILYIYCYYANISYL